jgi:hypothetical protein
MKTTFIKITLSLSFCFIYLLSFGQGCSDAGFCTMSGLQSEEEYTNNEIKVGISYGQADNYIQIVNPSLEYTYKASNKLALTAKVTAISQSSDTLSNFGLSDFYLSANYSLNEKSAIIIGGKLPLNNGNQLGALDLPLPLDYQSSLGTVDFILGYSLHINKLHIVTALQQPLTQNENTYSPILYDRVLYSGLKDFQATNQFTRQGDALLRLSYPLKKSEKIKVSASLLSIYHLGEDTYLDEFDVEQKIIGSDGLTINGNLFFDYYLSTKSTLKLSLASPFLVREVRPDGLTRSFVASLQYAFKF